MKNIRKALSAATLAATIGITSMTSAFAQPLSVIKAPQVSLIDEVQYYRRDRDMRVRRDVRRDGYYNGHRGYRERRPGYRYQNGYWFPLAAFGAGALIGGAVASQPRVSSGGGSSHVQWCSERYQSYRASDNTYAPRAGVRAQCNSPY